MKQIFERWLKNAESGLKWDLVLHMDEVKMRLNFAKVPKNEDGGPKWGLVHHIDEVKMRLNFC